MVMMRYMHSEIECLTVSDSLQVAQALNAKAVVLRLTAGSQEAGFLASFCPISKFPTVVLIKCAQPFNACGQVGVGLLTSFQEWHAEGIHRARYHER